MQRYFLLFLIVPLIYLSMMSIPTLRPLIPHHPLRTRLPPSILTPPPIILNPMPLPQHTPRPLLKRPDHHPRDLRRRRLAQRAIHGAIEPRFNHKTDFRPRMAGIGFRIAFLR